jgi:hypothetical protein
MCGHRITFTCEHAREETAETYTWGDIIYFNSGAMILSVEGQNEELQRDIEHSKACRAPLTTNL